MNLKMILSDFALRYLPEQYFTKLRNGYFFFLEKTASIQVLIRGSFGVDDLRKHLETQINEDFEILMVHSSINGMKPTFKGAPLELMQMLIDFCGPNRTLAMPAFFFGDPKVGTLNETLKQNPYFNMRRRPSQMGMLTELFRRSKGVCQSRHPSYRVSALGPLAVDLTKGHEHATSGAGIGSPFEFMTKHKTIILGIGKSFDVMTQVHHTEGVMQEDFPVPKSSKETFIPLDVIFVEGKEEIPAKIQRGGLQWRFNILKLPSLLQEGQLTCWKFHGVPFFKANAADITRTLIAEAKKGNTLYDPPKGQN